MSLPSSIPQRRFHLLCVDPNASYLRLYMRELEPQGHLVAVAASGQAALTYVEGQAIDLAFVALELPDMSGREVIHRIRTELGLALIPIVATSTGSVLNDLTFVTNYPNVVVLRKPFSGVRLVKLVARLL